MTWNIHGGVGPDARCDMGRVRDLVQSHCPDIVALQEVDSRRPTDCGDPFDFLAEALGGHALDRKLITAPDGEYGHLLVSRWPFSDTTFHNLSLSGREPRAAIETSVETRGGPLRLVSVHLGLSLQERRHQADLLADIVARDKGPLVMLGDFNDWVWRGSVQALLGRLFPARSAHRTFPARWPVFALDRIYCRPSEIFVRSWSDPAARCASDHLPVIADLQLGPLEESDPSCPDC